MEEGKNSDSQLYSFDSEEFKENIEDTLTAKLTLFVLFIGFFGIVWCWLISNQRGKQHPQTGEKN